MGGFPADGKTLYRYVPLSGSKSRDLQVKSIDAVRSVCLRAELAQVCARLHQQFLKVILSPWSVRCSLLQASVRYTHNWYPWLVRVEHRLCVSVSIIYISSDC